MFRYVPLSGKIPLFNNWQNDISNEPAKLSEWGKVTQDFGIATGHGFIVVDVDVKKENGFANLAAKGIELPATLKQVTQSGGAHYFYKTNKQFKNSVSKIAKGVDVRSTGGQVKVYDWSIIHKYNEMTELPKQIEDLILKDNSEAKKQIPVRFLNPEIELDNILEELTDAPEGERNATLFVKSCEVKSKLVNNGQLNQGHAYQKVYNTAVSMGLKGPECKATINSGFKTSELFTLPFTPVIVGDLRQSIAKERWLPNKPTMADLKNRSRLRRLQIFKDYSTRDITLINADGGTGKTTKLLFETVHAALGMPCYGYVCTGKYKTLFITGEDDAEKLYAVLGMICEQLNLTATQYSEVLDSVIIKKDIDLLLIAKDKMGFLIPNYPALNEIVAETQDFKPDRVIFDPIASFWGSEAALNDMSKAVAKWCGLLRDKLNCEVILVNHIGKASSQSKDITQFAGRGGSALPSHARVNKVMRRLDATEYSEMTGLTLGDREQALLEVCTKFTDYSPILDKPKLFLRKEFTFETPEIKNQSTTDYKVDSRSDDEIVYEFILHNETNGLECSKKFIESMLTGKISRAKIGDTLTRLVMVGLNGNKLFLSDSIDLTISDKVYKTTKGE